VKKVSIGENGIIRSGWLIILFHQLSQVFNQKKVRRIDFLKVHDDPCK